SGLCQPHHSEPAQRVAAGRGPGTDTSAAADGRARRTSDPVAGRPSRFSTAWQGWSGFTGDDQVLLHQFVLALDIVGVERDAVHRADLLALGFVVVADAFGAEVGVDDVDFLALGNGAVRALGL